uniref:Transposable element P transposase-like RNase H domain-containing protein n=1 Tax=Amphimedon queenslandica TaxID=400682 RepID=A0A1X7ULN9_AMPQE
MNCAVIEDHSVPQPQMDCFIALIQKIQLEMLKRIGNAKEGVMWHPLKGLLTLAEPEFTNLASAANLSSCDKLVMIRLDKIHLRENLTYDKHSGQMIGLVDLGSINNHLLAIEYSLKYEVFFSFS